MRFLLSWVGEADLAALGDGVGGPGPTLRTALARIVRPDRIRLLSTSRSERVRRYEAHLREATGLDVGLRVVRLRSPTDAAGVYRRALEEVDAARAEAAAAGDSARLHFNFSSGTPIMRSVWLLLAKAGPGGTLVESSPEHGVSRVDLPFDLAVELRPDLIREAEERLERLAAGEGDDATGFEGLQARSNVMRRVLARAARAAVRGVPVLVLGESGVGKEVLAKAVHEASERSDGPFVPVNCGAIPDTLIDSELFGHEEGAFTGARPGGRDGLVQAADGGTLFLDEIGELPLTGQVRLLRLLQEREVRRVGSDRGRRVDVRIVAATNRDLFSEAAEGRFREDLLYRLAVSVIRMPPLREREGDLGGLIDEFLARSNEAMEHVPGHRDLRLSPAARRALLRHDWPGNVRELQNTMLRLVTETLGPRIEAEDVDQALLPRILPRAGGSGRGRIHHEGAVGDDPPLDGSFDLDAHLAAIERRYLELALAAAGGTLTEAARLLGLASRQTLTNRLRRAGLR